MKVLVIVALFAFVAVQMCQAAPRPDDDKKEEPTPAAEPAAPAVAAEVKSPLAKAEPVAKVDVTAPPPEEKKD